MAKKYPKLPLRFKTKWIKALRSGKYQQGQYKLYNKENKTYCFLGVACSISGVADKEFRLFGMIDGELRKNPKIPEVLLGTNTLTNKLVHFNDSGYSFKRIANWIEKTL